MQGLMRIGELARRTGVSPELLRAWERRYGLLQPARSDGGFRLYSFDDEARVRRTLALINDGMAAAEAAQQAKEEPVAEVRLESMAPTAVAELVSRMRAALDRFESHEAHAAIDGLLSHLSVESFVTEVAVPYLHELGERWSAGTASIAQEHFAANLLRGRLLGMARDWGSGRGQRAVLACLPGESHDIGLILFGLLLARRGWRIAFLGSDTPLETLRTAVAAVRPALVVLSTVDHRRLDGVITALRPLTKEVRVAIAGPLDETAAARAGIIRLPDDIVEAVDAVQARRVRS
jgi:DNA-binding transcriptional MerR regulator